MIYKDIGAKMTLNRAIERFINKNEHLFNNMNINTEKLTKTEEEILSFLFVYPTHSFRGRALAKKLKKSPSGIIQSSRNLEKRRLITMNKDFTLSIKLNRENKKTFMLKRISNIRLLYESGLILFLSDKFPGSTLIIFGSYSYGEDTEESDVDIAIIGYSERHVDREEVTSYEKNLQRTVQLHFFKDIKSIHKNLRENIINGIVLEGAIKL